MSQISRRDWLKVTAAAAVPSEAESDLDPRGRIHIPIGIPNTLDTLKTFIEAEGNFSPGFGSFGIYFWLLDQGTGKLLAPTMNQIPCDRGLRDGLLIPWVRWRAGNTEVTTEICQVSRNSPAGAVMVVAARTVVHNRGAAPVRHLLLAALRAIGPAGYDLRRLEIGPAGNALIADGHPGLVAFSRPSGTGVLNADIIRQGMLPEMTYAVSETGDCCGALWFDCALRPAESRQFDFICPVLPGRRAARHRWEDRKQNAMVDTSELNPPDGGILQPDPGLHYYSTLRPQDLFDEAETYWRRFSGGFEVRLPDPRWRESLRAILGHAALAMNEGAPDVAVVNYNVFNRDGVYVANILQKAGQFALAEQALDYFLAHPFNGRAYPEADNPGQILWALAEQFQFTHDTQWLRRAYPAASRIAGLIEYLRTTAGPHWVNPAGLEFGDAAPVPVRQELKPGRCDGYHPEYTEAFDIAGLRAAVALAQAAGQPEDARKWTALAERLLASYDEKFSPALAKGYGGYAVLWPCRLYPLDSGKGHEQFRAVGERKPNGWRYFPLAAAHQGLLAGNREAGYATLNAHLAHPHMHGWYALDEGGGSASGAWPRVRTRWPHSKDKPGENRAVAMPHGWAIAEFWLLMRDSLVHENDDRLVLLAGVPPEWFRHPAGVEITNLPTHFGRCSVKLRPGGAAAQIELSGEAAPPGGFELRLPGPTPPLRLRRGKSTIRL